MIIIKSGVGLMLLVVVVVAVIVIGKGFDRASNYDDYGDCVFAACVGD